jgi:hypothetical protein
MTTRQPVNLDAVVAELRAMLADGVADEVQCEYTRHGTFKWMAKKGGQPVVPAPMRTGMGKRK